MMKLTILETGSVPAALADRFTSYPEMFIDLFATAGLEFEPETIAVADGAELPDPRQCEAVVITGSPAGVYDPFDWLEPLRAFIRTAYGHGVPMVGICFGHQIIADALGGVVQKSEKGWGLGRHTYAVTDDALFGGTARALSVACSHQDQVITPPAEAQTILASAFTPHAGLRYANGATLSFQPHPEFADDYAQALVDLRRDKAPAATITEAVASFETPSDSPLLALHLAQFLRAAHAARSR
jgi:GMP synthase-like glutamine amidotransferase